MSRSSYQLFFGVILIAIIFIIWHVSLGGHQGLQIRLAQYYLNAQKKRLDMSYSNYDWAWKPTPSSNFPDLTAVLEPIPPELGVDTLYYLGSDKGYTLFFVFGKKKVVIDSKSDGSRVEKEN